MVLPCRHAKLQLTFVPLSCCCLHAGRNFHHYQDSMRGQRNRCAGVRPRGPGAARSTLCRSHPHPQASSKWEPVWMALSDKHLLHTKCGVGNSLCVLVLACVSCNKHRCSCYGNTPSQPPSQHTAKTSLPWECVLMLRWLRC
jgi:hypothetical protein